MKIRLYAPLLVVEIYLVGTILLLFWGPIEFEIQNKPNFFMALVLYHVYFIFGYFIAVSASGRRAQASEIRFSGRLFNFSFSLGMLSILTSYQNIMLSTDLVPWNIFDDIGRGIIEPGIVYTERMASLDSGADAGSRLLNVGSIFFSFFKLLFIFISIFHWTALGFWRRSAFFAYVFIFVATGVVAGLNSVVFIFFIFSAISLVVSLYVKGHRAAKKVATFLVFLFLVPLLYFGNIMSQRGGGFDYFSTTSPLGHIYVAQQNSTLGGGFFDFLYYSYVWLTYYVVQGYYGLSLSLGVEHTWTFGFGNSAFSQRQLYMLTGLDVSELTFQRKISPYWHETAQWHSFYSQLANDFSFPGLSFFMLFLGFLFGRVWRSIVYLNSFYGMALMPIYSLLFIFMPANNQVFGYIDTLSYFFFIHLLWSVENRKFYLIRTS